MVIDLANGKRIEVPLSARDISYSDYLDFKKTAERYDALTAEEQIEESEFVLIEAVSNIIKGDIGSITFNVDKLKQKKKLLTKGAFMMWMEDKKISIVRLYAHILQLISTYRSSRPSSRLTFNYKHEGEFFYITPSAAKRAIISAMYLGLKNVKNEAIDKLNEILIHRHYTAGEVIECKEIMRLIDGKIKKEGDPFGNLEFTMDLNLLAVIFRKDNESLPILKHQRDLFIERRMKKFETLPMSVVLDVFYFFFFTCRRLIADPMQKFSIKDDQKLISVDTEFTRQRRKLKARIGPIRKHKLLPKTCTKE